MNENFLINITLAYFIVICAIGLGRSVKHSTVCTDNDSYIIKTNYINIIVKDSEIIRCKK